MTNVCCFELVVSVLKICIDVGSCLSQIVCLIIHVRGGLLLNGAMYQAFVHIDQ